ncbi:MAG: hypothetical protein K8T26_10360 [Lentisphaerae bacterium]|nr:hypothetical protein [Lentisphaerota bacterium]
MKTQHALFATLFAMSLGAAAWGQSLPGTMSTDYLAPADWLQKVTVGADVEQIGRTVEPDDGPDVELDVIAYGAFFGYDVTPAVTAFITIGGTDDNTFDDAEDDSGSALKFSAGANINVAAYNIRHPALLNGDRVTLRLQPEVASYDADSCNWMQASLALPITYEIVEVDTYTDRAADDRFVVALYAGPQISYIDGEIDHGAQQTDFEASQVFGIVGGADLYLTRYFAMGAHVSVFDTDDDTLTGGGSVRYHF